MSVPVSEPVSRVTVVPSDGVSPDFAASVVDSLVSRHPAVFARRPDDGHDVSVACFVSVAEPGSPAPASPGDVLVSLVMAGADAVRVDLAERSGTVVCGASAPPAVASVVLDVVMRFAAAFPPAFPPSAPNVPLASVGLFVTVANVRRPLSTLDVDPSLLCVGSGVGQVGDIVVGDVAPFAPPPLHIHDQSRTLVDFHGPRVRVMVALGNRQSSTHANGGIPDEGLPITLGTPVEGMVWLTGSSGLVGKLYHDPAYDTKSPAFHSVGLLQFPDSHPTRAGHNVNILDLAVKPVSTTVTTPVVIVAGTSAEAGKSTMASLLVRSLTERCGMAVATVKATGTGGIGDTAMHTQAGAVLSLDQVDAGMPTTYKLSPDVFQTRIVTSVLAAQDSGADVLVIELGGDIIWANNPALLSLPAIQDAIDKVFVICNDALSALGVRTFAHESLPDLPEAKIAMVCSPFRSVAGMAARADLLRMPPLLDPNSADELLSVLSCCADKLATK